MVFSTDKLIKQENIDNTPMNSKTVITVSENTSLFLDTLTYMIEEDRLIAEEINKYTASTYTARRKLLLSEAEINININTPLSKLITTAKSTGSGIYNYMKTNFTIENIVKFIINAFLKILSRLWREFEAICMSIVSKSSQIKRLEKKISIMPTNYTYKQPIFYYTHIRDARSEVELEDELRSISSECINFISSFSQIKNSSRDIEAAINAFNRSSSNDLFELDEIRGKLLGMNSPVYREDFADVLFKYFRNGTNIPTMYNVLDPNDIRKRLLDWQMMPRLIKGYQRDKDKLEKAGNELVSNLEKVHIDKYLDEVPASTLDLYTNLIRRFSTKIKDTCEIFLVYYSQRLDAAKEELKTNTSILFEVAKYIVREGL